MLDSCQYEPKNEVGGMIRRETYEWMEPILEEAEREEGKAGETNEKEVRSL